jgi:hypothetical protein
MGKNDKKASKQTPAIALDSDFERVATKSTNFSAQPIQGENQIYKFEVT